MTLLSMVIFFAYLHVFSGIEPHVDGLQLARVLFCMWEQADLETENG